MDLTKKIELHFGQSPVRGATQLMQTALERESEFCAIYAENDLPSDVHNRTNDHMLDQFGAHSQFAKDTGRHVRPYLVEVETGLATIGASAGITDPNAQTMKGTGIKAGGTFFDLAIAPQVLEEFKRLGYEIDKKYD